MRSISKQKDVSLIEHQNIGLTALVLNRLHSTSKTVKLNFYAQKTLSRER